MSINQITIIGTGLIGGSFGLALKKRGFAGRIVGCDKPIVLAQAERIGAIDIGIVESRQAVQGSDVILLSTPVGGVLDLIEKIGPLLAPHVLLTDVGSTKKEIVDRAQAVFGSAAASRYLAGHPMAGKEHSGIEHADADLFENAVWLFAPVAGQTVMPEPVPTGPVADFVSLVQSVGARVLGMDADRHDRVCAWVSHLPQMLATALASSLEDEFGDDEALKAVGGRALREMTRIAASPYSMWRDIAFTNTGNIAEALSKLEQRLAHIRENLRTRGLQEEFENGNKFRKS
jgi:prephenate dehydrogenase